MEHPIRISKDAEEALRKSEERYRAFVMATSDVVYRMSADWRVMVGLEGQNFVADGDIPNAAWLEQNIHPDDRQLVLDAIEAVIRTKGIFELEHRVFRADGTVGWTFSRAIPLLDEQGEIIEWFGVARDVTERKHAQEAMERLTAESNQERRLYQAIFSSTPDFAYVFSLTHRVIYANTALLKMWGRSWEDTIGNTFLGLGYEPWHAEMHEREIDQVAATKKPIRGEVPFNGTGGRRIYDYIFVPVFDGNGNVEAVAGTTRDITEMVEAREQLARHRQELEILVEERTAKLKQAMEQMEEFSYSVSHDLRAPIRAMSGYAEAILQDAGEGLGSDAREMLQRILQSGERMDRLTQDLLTYTRIGRAPIRLERISLEPLVRDVICQYPKLLPENADIEIVTPLLDVIGHEPSLTQVLSNLLTNAVKFIRPGTRPRVRVRGEPSGDQQRLWIEDNGIGIKAEHHERLFKMFERVHPKNEYDGTGVGLAIVRRAVDRMNGSVGMESDGFNGSRFWVNLPLAGGKHEESNHLFCAGFIVPGCNKPDTTEPNDKALPPHKF